MSEAQYSGSNITVLEGLEAVRVRPAMYIGSTDVRGLHHLVWEVVDNSVDEALAGFCTEVDVTITKENSIVVKDNGRGIPTDMHPTEKVGTLEVVMTKLHAGGKFDSDTYKVSAGLHGVGVSCVNALSSHLKAEVHRNGKIVTQEFERGKPHAPQSEEGTTDISGTFITFQPDPEIFTDLVYNFDTLASRMRELAFLNDGLKFVLTDEREEENGAFKTEEFHYPGGIKAFVEYLDHNKKPLFEEPICVKKLDGEFPLEIALHYNESYQENMMSFVNNVNTYEGGTHVAGLKASLTRAINKFAADHLPKGKKDVSFTGDDIREGMTCIISIKLAEPQFEGQTKRKLGNAEVKGIVEQITGEMLNEYFEENPSVIKKIIDKVYNAALAREAARKAKQLARRKNVLEGGGLPGKLADCSSRNPEESEIFIVEGDSAGGSAKQGRNREFQAILPLKGKILNVEKSRIDKILGNDEINTIISALGCGMGEEDFNIDKLRYHKIIIMTDADIDGSHIQTLILTFFFRHMPKIIENGMLYMAQPPLYKIKSGKYENYAFTEVEKDKILEELGKTKGVYIQRYKGLGEMNPEQLATTTMQPETRFLKRIEMNDYVHADQVFAMLMGDEVTPRREFIEKNAYKILNELDV